MSASRVKQVRWLRLPAILLIAAVAGLTVAIATGFGRGPEPIPAADCTRAAAKRMISEGDFAAVLTRVDANPAGGSGLRNDRLQQFECADLTGDGDEEMVVRVGQGKPAAISPWGIFRSVDGEWALALARDLVTAELQVTGSEVIEAQPVFAEDANACCPSGERTGSVSWDGGGFVFTPGEGASETERTVVSSGATVSQVGAFDPRTGAAGALAAFGTPARTTNLGTSCLREWPDIGLAIAFASLGSVDSCNGAVQSVSVDGLTGQQAGWRTKDGMVIGGELTDVQALYPNARHDAIGVGFPLPRPGSAYVLRDEPRFGTQLPVLAARVQDQRVLGLDFYVGLAGE